MSEQQNKYLARKGQPATEGAFLTEYGITMQQGRVIIARLTQRYKFVNPEAIVSYDRTYDKETLTIIFQMAASNYYKFLGVIEVTDCRLLPFHMWLDNMARQLQEE